MGWAFQKDSELVDCFNYNLQKMFEAGIINNELRKTGAKYNEDFRYASIFRKKILAILHDVTLFQRHR